ncbi:hypothetical protein AVXHC19_40080 [Acidovorax sacchari]
MRRSDTFTESLFSINKLEDFAPATHPFRAILAMVNDALSQLEDLFAGMYEDASKDIVRGAWRLAALRR